MVTKIYGHQVKYLLVFDGSYLFEGNSNYLQLLTGPNKLNKMLYILSRFRRFLFILVGDLEAIYMRIHVANQDRKFLRMVYSPTGDPQKVEVLAGTPFVANATKKIQRHIDQLPHPLESGSSSMETLWLMTSSNRRVVATSVRG